MRKLVVSNKITDKDSDSVARYFMDVNKYDLIDAAEEIRLSDLIKEGNEDALQRLVKANLRFVISVAKFYHNKNNQLSDLINEGNIGLIKAAKTFDASYGVKFISYAVNQIRAEIIYYINTQTKIVHIPVNKWYKQKKDDEFARHMEQEHGYIITSEDVKYSNNHISLDEHLDDESDMTRGDLIIGDMPATTYEILDKEELNTLFECLTNRERVIVIGYFGLNDLNFNDSSQETSYRVMKMSSDLNITTTRILQIFNDAMNKLKNKKEKLRNIIFS